jgi:hypothetical protein
MKANFTLGVPGQATTFMRTKVVEEYACIKYGQEMAHLVKKKREEILLMSQSLQQTTLGRQHMSGTR